MPRATTSKSKKTTKKDKEVVEYTTETMGILRDAFVAAYIDPMSPSRGKIQPSAVKAGFSPFYAKNLSHVNPQWLREIVGKLNLRDKARENLQADLDIDPESVQMSFGKPVVDKKTGQLVKKLNPRLLEVRQKATFFTLEKLEDDFKKEDKNEKGGDTILNKLEFHINFPEGFVPPVTRYAESTVVDVEPVAEETSEVITPEPLESSELITATRRPRRAVINYDDANLQIPEDTRVIDDRKKVASPNVKKMLKDLLEEAS